ncbi:MAG: 5-formyltetrahydrofolate cyclo-ligase [Lentilitoribacter sp.]
MSDIKTLKTQIRNMALSLRNGLTDAERVQFSKQIKSFFFELDIAPNAITSAFLPIKTEVDLNELIHELWSQHRSVCLPYMLDKENIEFREYNKTTELIDNGFGTLAPSGASEVVDPDVMLVPLSAFDETGGRIGYGAGFYDRAIVKLLDNDKTPLLIGIAFACQQVDRVPCEDHDIPLDMILTENGLIIAD